MIFQYGATGGIQQVFRVLVDWGLLDAILPFIILFGIIFTVLDQIGLFDEKKYSSIIAFAIAAMVVFPHVTGMYPAGMDPIVIINSILPSSAILLAAVLLVLIMVGLAGGKIPSEFMWGIGLLAIIVLIFVIIGASVPSMFRYLGPLRDPNLQAILIALLSMGLVIYFIVRSPPTEKTFIERFVGKID